MFGQGGAMLCWGSEKLVWDNGLHPGALAPPGLQLSDGHDDPPFQVGPADFGF